MKSIDTRVKKDLVDLLYKQSKTALFASLVVGVVLTWVLYGVIANTVLIAWFSVLSGLMIVRWVHGRVYVAQSDDINIERWGNSFVVLVGLAGCVWGSAGVYLTPLESPVYLAATVSVLMGMVSGVQSSPKIFLIFAVPTLMPLGIRLLMFDHPAYTIMGGLLFFFLLASLSYQRPRYQALLEGMALRYENLELVDRLQEQKLAAEKANIEKSKFLAAASHDLRQPLHSLELFFESLRNEKHTENGLYLLEKTGASLDALRQLFDALLDVSRLDAGIIEIRRQHFSLNELLEVLEAEFSIITNEQQRSIHLVSEDSVVYTDKLLLERVLRNLLRNAVKHGDGVITIALHVTKDKQVVSISDEGKGIPEQELDNIFTEFHQIKNTERDRSKGLGLGLAIARRISDLLNYELSVQSTLEQGATFSIVLPVADATNLLEPDETPVASHPASHHWNLQDTQVLVIDDEKNILIGMQCLLEGWGCKVWFAEDEHGALDIIADGVKPDLILCDYRLRNNRTGVEVLAILQKQLNKEVPALLITGDTAPERLREAHESGLVLLHKPIKPAKLRMAMVSVLSTK